MATHTYPYACGHGEKTVKLYGLLSEQEQKINKLKATSRCPECRKKPAAPMDIEREINLMIDGVMDRQDGIVTCIMTDGETQCDILFKSPHTGPSRIIYVDVAPWEVAMAVDTIPLNLSIPT